LEAFTPVHLKRDEIDGADCGVGLRCDGARKVRWAKAHPTMSCGRLDHDVMRTVGSIVTALAESSPKNCT